MAERETTPADEKATEATSTEEKPEAPSWLIETIAEASKNARTVYVLYVSFLAYCALTAVSTTDRQIVLNEGASLPVIGVEVPFNVFIVAAPVLATFFFCYLQLYLQRLKSLRRKLRADYPADNRKQIYPWMVNIAEDPEPGWTGNFQRGVVQISLWWLLPSVLTLIAWLYLKKHVPVWSYVMGWVPVFGAFLVLYFWHQYEKQERRPGEIWFWLKDVFFRPKRNWPRSLMFVFAIVLGVFNSVAINRSFEGKRTLGGAFFIDLSNQVLVTERKAEYDVPWLDLEGFHLEGATLDGAVLKNARLKWAHLKRASLRNAQLEGANLWGAQLQGADLVRARLDSATLRGAWMQWAVLREARLNEAILIGAHLRNTRLNGARLRKADFRNAEMQGAILTGARLDSAYFVGSQMQHADLSHTQMQGAVLDAARLDSANLDHAYLKGANLKMAWFGNAYLGHANFQDTFFPFESVPFNGILRPRLQTLGVPGASTLCEARNFYKIEVDFPLLGALLRQCSELFAYTPRPEYRFPRYGPLASHSQ